MSKPIKNLIVQSYKSRFEGLTGAVLIDIRGIEANQNNHIRASLAQKNVRITVVKNSLAKLALQGTELTPIGDMLEGSTAMVYPMNGDTTVVSIARDLIGLAKEIKQISFKGAVMEGMVFGPDEIDALSKYPTREEAQGQVVQILLSPAQNLVGAILSPGRTAAALVKAIEEKLEKGEEIKKAG